MGAQHATVSPEAVSTFSACTACRCGKQWHTAMKKRAHPRDLRTEARRFAARVKRWRDGDMRKRWCTARLLRAESKFRRVKGYRPMPRLLKALEGIVLGKQLDETRKVA